MRPIRSLLVFIAVVFVGGALLAPWLYWLAQAFSQTFPDLAQKPFHRYMNRSMLVLALIGLWPFLRGLGMRSAADLGLTGPKGQGRRCLGGLLVGFGSLALVAGLALAAGARKINPDAFAGDWARKLAGIVLTAVTVALLEEVLFRGALFGALRRAWHWIFALVISSMVYAILHFMESARLAGAVTWTSGLELLPQMLRGFAHLQEVVPGFFNLTLAGMILGLGYQRTGNLYFSICLHAGWIFWVKAWGWLSVEVPGSSVWFWGTRKLVDGWVAFPALVIVLFLLLRFFRQAEGRRPYGRICF